MKRNDKFTLKRNAMIVFPNAKLNIGLRITARRSDGYHDIETIFYPVKICDALEFVVSDLQRDTLAVTGHGAGDPEGNLVLKALRLLRERFSFPFLRLHLHKSIPAGAGLGGGSSDAACTIKAVTKHFALHADDNELKEMALLAGSDCPFFIDNVPSYATGRGELLKPVPEIKEKLHIVLVNPGVHSSTADAYASCTPAKPAMPLDYLVNLPVEEWKEHILNDFEEYAFSKFPVIGEIKKSLYNAGAVFSLMSGSGSTVYGLFRKAPVVPGEFRKFVIYEGLL